MLDDPLLKPQKMRKELEVILYDRAQDTQTSVTATLNFVHNPQLLTNHAERKMGGALFGIGTAPSARGCIDAVAKYYGDVDKGDLDAICHLFADDTALPMAIMRNTRRTQYSTIFSWDRPRPMNLVSTGTTYKRCEHVMDTKDAIDSFYSSGPEGRKLSGKHTLSMMYGIPGLVWSFGSFSGTDKQGNDVSLDFGDIWHFKNTDADSNEIQVAERRTYLGNNPETLAIEHKRAITPQDLLEQKTFVINFSWGMLFEVVGYPHNPDLGHLGYKLGTHEQHYFNIGGEKIK